MKSKTLAGILAGVLMLAGSKEVYAEKPGCESRNSFYYDISNEEGYANSYFASINNNLACRIAGLNRIKTGDYELQLIDSSSTPQNPSWRIIPLSYFLDKDKEYEMCIVDCEGEERAFDDKGIVPGDRGLRFYEIKKSKESKPIPYSTLPLYKKDLKDGFEIEVRTPEGKKVIERFKKR